MIKRNMITPVAVAVGLLILLLMAWLPSDPSQPQQQRPIVLLSMQYDAGSSVIRPLAEDLRYRMRTHHEYRLVEGDQAITPQMVIEPVEVRFAIENSIVTIRADIAGQTVAVDGPTEVASHLPAKLFSLINTRLRVVFAD